MKNIISASRRTDIPAFYSEWFVQRMKDEEVFVKNPYGGQVTRVSLAPDNIHCIVLWSKNYSPFLVRVEDVERFTKKLFFHFTITGLPDEIEQHTPPYKEAIDDYIYIAARYSPDHVIWRFDPVCITDKVPFELIEAIFTECAEKLEGSCLKCYISFVQMYKKALFNFRKYSSHEVAVLETGIVNNYAARLAAIAAKYGIQVYACCNDHLLSDSVMKGSCINSSEMSRLFNDPSINSPHHPTRKECGCSKSIDIGTYNTCAHGCLYCYANADKEKAAGTAREIDKNMNGLGFHIDDKSSIVPASSTKKKENKSGDKSQGVLYKK